MKKVRITIELIRRLRPCYDPVTGRDDDGHFINQGYLTEDYEATIIEFLRHPEIPVEDKFWLVLRKRFMYDKALRLFAVWCAREAMKLVESPSPAIIDRINVVERFANGKATAEDLDDQTWEMLSPLLMSSRAAAWAAAEEATTAARAASRSAARAAAEEATYDAGTEAWSATYDAAREAQLKKLILMIQNPTLHEGA